MKMPLSGMSRLSCHAAFLTRVALCLLRWGTSVAAAVTFSPTTSPIAAELQPPTTTDHKPISRSEILLAVETGAPIIGRTIVGEDLTAALSASMGQVERCDARRALLIDSSSINGDVTVTAHSQEKETTDGTVEERNEPSSWLSIPLSIRASTVSGQVTLSKVGLSCKLDLSDSRFGDTFDAYQVTFGSDVIAEKSVFSNGIEAIGSQWRGMADFRRAQFRSTAEFIRQRSPSEFLGNADFAETVFYRVANFLGTKFEGHTDFRFAQFMHDAQFSNTTIGPGPAKSFAGVFNLTEFIGQAIFRETHFQGLRLYRTIFRNGVDFHHAHGQSLQLQSVTLNGQGNFDDSVVDSIEFNGFSGPMTVDGNAIFRRASFTRLSFARLVFKKAIDFEETSFLKLVKLQSVSFDGDIHLEDTILPPIRDLREGEKESGDISGIVIKDVTINGGLYVGAQQFLVRAPWWAVWVEDKSRFEAIPPVPLGSDEAPADDARFWRELARAFQSAGNLDLKNYAEYRVRYLAEQKETEPSRTFSALSRWFWGYGLRPARVLCWTALFVTLFAGAYWLQLSQLGRDRSVIGRLWLQAKTSMTFSFRTAWELKFGYEHSRTGIYRAIAVSQSILGKLLLACFAYSLTQTSPLLSDLVKKLLP